MKNLLTTLLFFFSALFTVNAQTFDWVNTIQTFNYTRDFDLKSGPGGSIYHAGTFEDSIKFNFNIGANQILNNNGYGSYIMKKNNQGVVTWFKYIQATITDFSVDENGNSYLFVMYSLDFDADPGSSIFMLTTATNLALGNFLSHAVIKLDVNGNFLWAKNIFSQGLSDAKMTGDKQGGIYITGVNFGKIDLDPSSAVFAVPLQAKAVIFKWNNNGVFLWGGSMMSNIQFTSISARKNQVIFTGYFSGTIDFNIDTNIVTNRSTNFSENFILGYDTSGIYKWVRNYPQGNTTILNGSYIDQNMNSYFSGLFFSQMDFNFGTGQAILNPINGTNSFLLKLDSNGVFDWVRQIANQSFNSSMNGLSVTVDNLDNVYLSGIGNGIFNSTPTSPNINLINTNNQNRVVTVRYSYNGGYKSHLMFGGNDFIALRNVILGKNNSLNYIGVFADSVNFSPSGSTQFQVSDSGFSSRYILRLNQCFETNSQLIAQSCGDFLSPSGNYVWNTSGTFLDTIPNHMGCDSVIDVNLSVVNTDTTLFLLGSSLANNEFSAAFQWLDCNSNYAVIPNQTAQLFTPTQNGNYALEITKNGCVDTTSCFAYTLVGNQELSLENSIQIFPNPSNGQFNLLMSSSYDRLTITDISGRIVWNQNESSNLNTTIDLSFCKNGIYFMEIVSEGERAVKKIIKK